MGLLKRNGVSILGWSVFVGLYYLLVRFPYIYLISQIHAQFPTFKMNAPTAVLIFLGIVLLNFVAFAISIRMVVLPIAMSGNLQMIRSKYPLFFEWVIFCIVFLFFSWAIGYVQALLKLIAVPDTVISMLKPIWQIVVSFGLYRGSVMYYLKKFSDQLENAKIQVQEPANTTV